VEIVISLRNSSAGRRTHNQETKSESGAGRSSGANPAKKGKIHEEIDTAKHTIIVINITCTAPAVAAAAAVAVDDSDSIGLLGLLRRSVDL
jgi:hypothetical protein